MSAAGSDANTFSQAQSTSTTWLTISKLNGEFVNMTAGDTVAFRRGDNFAEIGLILAKSGITFVSYGTGSNAVISGYADLTWTNIGGNLWQSQILAFRPYSVTIGGIFRNPGRMPKTGYYTYETSSGTGSITDNQLTGSWTGAEVVVRKNHTIWDKGTATQSGTTLTFTPIYGDGFINGYGYFLQNHADACTVDGDWYYNSSNRIILYSTTTPANCKASQVAKLFDTNGYSATVDGVDFTGSNEYTINAINIATGGFIIKNSAITNSGDRAIYLSSSPSSLIENCTITYTNATAIEANTCANVIVRSNSLLNTGIEGQGIRCEGHGMVFINQSTGGLAELNSIINTGHNGINIYFSSNFTAQKNFIDTFNRFKEDGGGIYTWLGFLNGTYTNIQILNNIVLNGVGAASSRPDTDYQPSFGIYLDDQVANTTVSGNTVAGCAQSGIFLHNVNNNTITNNLLYNNGNSSVDATRASQIFLQDDGGYHTGLVCTGNIFFARTTYQFSFKADYSTATIGSSFTTLDNNYYCKPISEATFKARTYINGAPTAIEHTFSAWKTYTGKDAASAQTYRTVTSIDSLRLEYNATNATVNRSLPYKYVDHAGTVYDGSVSLAAYSGKVLIYQSAATTQSYLFRRKRHGRLRFQ